ncbi:hypothetical protein QTV49_004893 [Vibrio vulnificus]|nr:hypothetical protein [Vibrio vulnificus]
MKIKYEKLKLNEDSLFRFGDDAFEGDIQSDELFKQYPPKICFDKGIVMLPCLGADHPYLKRLCEILIESIEVGYYFYNDDFWGFHRKRERVKHFLKTGSFVISRTKKVSAKEDFENRKQLNAKAEIIKSKFLKEIDRQVIIAKERLEHFDRSDVKMNMVVKFSSSPNVRRSRGGRKNNKPYLKFALINILQTRSDTTTFNEYDSISRRSDIGSFTGSADKYIAGLVAHELAHLIQYEVNYWMKKGVIKSWSGMRSKEIAKPHGEGWRYIYSVLRKHAVNNMV